MGRTTSDTSTKPRRSDGSGREALASWITKTLANAPRAVRSSPQLAREAYLLRSAYQVPEELALLLRLVRRHRPNVVVEIGTAYGGTFYALCQVAPSRSTLVSLDLPGGDFGRGYRPETVSRLRRLAKRRQMVHFLPLDSHEPSSKVALVELLADAPIDFLLIDGDHTYEGVKADFDMYAPLVADGGLVAFHDVVPGKPERVGGVPDFWAEVSERFESVEFVKSWKQGGFGIGVVRTPSHGEAADLSRARAWRDAQESATTLGGRRPAPRKLAKRRERSNKPRSDRREGRLVAQRLARPSKRRPTEKDPIVMLGGAGGRGKQLLIVSVYAASPWNRSWHALQCKYIAETTADCAFDYQLFLNGVHEDEIGASGAVIGRSDVCFSHGSVLQAIVEELHNREYEHYLLLDSDCFPIWPAWFSVLVGQMTQRGASIAAPIRFENLDRFPHPCAFFFTREALLAGLIDFGESPDARNLLDAGVNDVGSAMTDLVSAQFFPLLRTNVVNVHPVMAAIYAHLFYHHGAGSRRFAVRVIDRYHYHDHWQAGEGSLWAAGRSEASAAALRELLFADPDRFIGYLTGENQDVSLDLTWRTVAAGAK